MERQLESYLDTVDRCLRPMPASERVDIVREIKSEILELEAALRTLYSLGSASAGPDFFAASP